MSPPRDFDAAVLAGGRSRRMGTDKALLRISGATLLARQVALCDSLGARRVWVSGRTPAQLEGLDASALPDDAPGRGPLGGIATVLRASRAPHLLVLAVDMPLLDTALLGRLLRLRAPGMGVVPRGPGGCEPLAAVYPTEFLATADAALAAGSARLRPLLDEALAAGRFRALPLAPADERLVASWNSPGDVVPESSP